MGTGEFLGRIRRFAHRGGIELRRFEPLRDDPELRIATLCRHLEVDLLVDVGASYGEWAGAIRGAGYAGDILSFEPHPSVYADLLARAQSDGRWAAKELALGSDSGEAKLKLTDGTVWSSLLPAADDGFQPTVAVGEVSVPVERLDALLSGDRHERLFLKLDVQGLELETFRGAERIVPRVVGGKAEVMLRELYDGQPTLTEFLAALDRFGFLVIGFEHGLIEPNGRERFVDLLFARV
jgi:FkbM family methyltransferase